MIKEYSAGAIIYYSENGHTLYLILQYAGGHWDIPKGHIEAGETRVQAAIREIKEETNLDVIVDQGFEKSFSYLFRNPHGILVSKTVYIFVAQAFNKDVILSHEHKNFAWLPFDKITDKTTYENTREVLRAAQNYIKKAGNT